MDDLLSKIDALIADEEPECKGKTVGEWRELWRCSAGLAGRRVRAACEAGLMRQVKTRRVRADGHLRTTVVYEEV